MNLARHAAITFGLAVASLLLAPSPAMAGRARAESLQVGADRFVKYTINEGSGPPVEYYISRTSKPAPIALYIQGSGCAPAFIEMQPGNFASTVFSLTTTAHRGQFAVMVVNKPFAPPRPPRSAGLAKDCPEAFNRYFSFETWLRQVNLAFNHALHLPWVRKERSLVIGVSEGATVAAGLAAINPKVTDVALVGGSGPGQFFDFIAGAYHANAEDDAKLTDLQALQNQLKAIQADPMSSSKFAWGHSYKRWSTFFRSSSLESLRRSRARIYLVSGMEDQSVPIISTEVLYGELAVAGRDIQFRRIPNADHNLVTRGHDFAGSFPQIEAEFVRITDWFYAGSSTNR